MGIPVGIDLGTTNTLLAAYIDGAPRVISSNGSAFIPSIVSLDNDGTVIVGESAKRQLILKPSQTIFSSKRFIGRSFTEIKNELWRFPSGVIAEEEGAVRFNLHSFIMSPEEIAAHILKAIVSRSEEVLGEEIQDAVITVPAYFNDSQRKATLHAAEIAGINPLRIVNEPTAAALYHGYLQPNFAERLLVFDLGGGTLDVSALDISEGVWEVKSTSGDAKLGGDDFDSALLKWALSSLDSQHGVSVDHYPEAIQRIKLEVERMKCELSTMESSSALLPFLTEKDGAPVNLELKLDRISFDILTKDLIERCKKPTEEAIANAAWDVEEIDQVLLVGGASRTPAIKRFLTGILNGKEPVISSRPEEAVALGAALQAAILAGAMREMVLLDVSPFTLGIRTKDEMTPLIPRNTPLPARASEYFATDSHFQRAVDVIVLEGESKKADECRELGRFGLEGLKAKVKGDAAIEVTFELSEDIVLTVIATDLDNEKFEQVELSCAPLLDPKKLKIVREKAFKEKERNTEERKKLLAQKKAERCIESVDNFMKKEEIKPYTPLHSDLTAKVDKLKELVAEENLTKAVKVADELFQEMEKLKAEKVSPPRASEK